MPAATPEARREVLPWRQRRGVALIALGIATVTIALLAGPSWALVLYRLLTDGVLVLVWLGACAGIAAWIPLPRNRQLDPRLELVTRTALGIGILGLLVFILGMFGGLNHRVAIALILGGLASGVLRIARWKPEIAPPWWRQSAGVGWLWLAIIPIGAIALVSTFAPPGVLWGDEPHGYDVVEYHLQLPREWYELGRITHLEHNVFSHFPLAMEMHYLLAMHLRGGPWAGMYLAQLMHLATVALVVLAIYALARDAGAMCTLGAITAAAVPWMALVGSIAYNEGALLLFATLAIGWTLRAMNNPKPGAAMILAGAFAGFACGVKLTAVPTVLLSIPVALFVCAIVYRTMPMMTLVRACALFVLIGAVVYCPWLIRNTIATGNPVFPEARTIFGQAHFSDVQAERWARAHSPTESQRTVTARLESLATQWLTNWRYGFVLMPLAILAGALTYRNPATFLLVLLLLLIAVFWLSVTHLQGRFMILSIPIIALMVAQIRERHAIVTVFVALLTAGSIVALTMRYIDRVAMLRDEGVLGIENLSFLVPEVVADLPPDATLHLVGDARAFLYQVPTARLRYRTVFDVDVKEGQSLLDAWLVDPPGPRDIVHVDSSELSRFARTYHGIPSPE